MSRMITATSGPEARGEPDSENRPYSQSYAYDGFNHLTSQIGKHWSSPNILSSTSSFTGNRRDYSTYDADGNLLQGDFPDTYSYNSAGQVTSVQAVDDNLNQVFDGDGLRVKTTETMQSNGGSTTQMTYYLTSSVLGGRLLSEMTQSGGKRRTLVYAGDQVLAWQTVVLGAEHVMWEHRDPSNASFRTTNVNGSLNDQTYIGEGAPAELDPTGANADLFDPYLYEPSPEENFDSLMPYPSFGGASTFGTAYTWDGIRMPADELFETVNTLLHGRFGIAHAIEHGTRFSGTRTVTQRWRVQPIGDELSAVAGIPPPAPYLITISYVFPLSGTDPAAIEFQGTLQNPVTAPYTGMTWRRFEPR